MNDWRGKVMLQAARIAWHNPLLNSVLSYQIYFTHVKQRESYSKTYGVVSIISYYFVQFLRWSESNDSAVLYYLLQS